jgi:exosortase A
MKSMHRPAPLPPNRGLDADFAAAIEKRAGARVTEAVGWRPAVLLIALTSLAFGYVFRQDIDAAVRVWLGSTAYNHCFLILPLIAFLLWERRSVFSAVSPSPTFWPLLALPLLSAVWLICAVLDLNEGRQLAVVAMFEVALLAILGFHVVRLLLAPVLFLFFLVPSGEFLVPGLQKITADIAVHGLQLLHIPVFSDGMMIEIPEGRFEIAEACAGLRFLVASIVFGCFFAVVMYRSYWRRLLFIVLSLSVPIGANGLRALGIIVLAHLEGSAAAVEADHVLYGWIFFSLVILLLMAIGMTFTDTRERPPAPVAGDRLPPPLWRLAGVSAVAVVLAAAGPGYAAHLENDIAASALPSAPEAVIAPPWRAVDKGGGGWRPVVHGADRELLQAFAEPGYPPVVEFVALYRLRLIGNALTNSENRIADDKLWQVTRQARAEAAIAGRPGTIDVTQMVSGLQRRLTWSFYLVDGKITAGLIEAKLLQARAVLLGRASLAAFVAASADADDPSHPADAQLGRFFAARKGLIERLLALSHGPALPPGVASGRAGEPRP